MDISFNIVPTADNVIYFDDDGHVKKRIGVVAPRKGFVTGDMVEFVSEVGYVDKCSIDYNIIGHEGDIIPFANLSLLICTAFDSHCCFDIELMTLERYIQIDFHAIPDAIDLYVYVEDYEGEFDHFFFDCDHLPTAPAINFGWDEIKSFKFKAYICRIIHLANKRNGINHKVNVFFERQCDSRMTYDENCARNKRIMELEEQYLPSIRRAIIDGIRSIEEAENETESDSRNTLQEMERIFHSRFDDDPDLM